MVLPFYPFVSVPQQGYAPYNMTTRLSTTLVWTAFATGLFRAAAARLLWHALPPLVGFQFHRWSIGSWWQGELHAGGCDQRERRNNIHSSDHQFFEESSTLFYVPQ